MSHQQEEQTDFWELKLYVSGTTARNIAAFRNLKRICDENLNGHCHITVIDLARNPQVAFTEQIIATPTLIKEFPLPLRKIVGDLSNTPRVLAGLDILPRPYI